jgi:hypothetical protein
VLASLNKPAGDLAANSLAGQRTSSAYPLRGKYSSCRSVSYTRGVARHGIRNALPQAQHLDTARYVAIAQNRGFSLALRVRTVSVTASSHSDRPKLALTALDRDRRTFWELKQAFCPTNKTMSRRSLLCQLCAEFIPATWGD